MSSAAVLLPALPGRSRPANARADLSKVLPAVRCTRKQNGEPCRAKAPEARTLSSPRRFRPTCKGRCQAQTRPGSRRFGPAPLGVRFGWRHVRERCATCDYRSARPRWSQRQEALELSASAEPKPYEEMLMGITGIAYITREESRARRGLPAPETPELPAPPAARELLEVVDAELVPGPDDSPTDPSDGPAHEGTRPRSDNGPDRPAANARWADERPGDDGGGGDRDRGAPVATSDQAFSVVEIC